MPYYQTLLLGLSLPLICIRCNAAFTKIWLLRFFLLLPCAFSHHFDCIPAKWHIILKFYLTIIWHLPAFWSVSLVIYYGTFFSFFLTSTMICSVQSPQNTFFSLLFKSKHMLTFFQFCISSFLYTFSKANLTDFYGSSDHQ